jgi:hypothetical protein
MQAWNSTDSWIKFSLLVYLMKLDPNIDSGTACPLLRVKLFANCDQAMPSVSSKACLKEAKKAKQSQEARNDLFSRPCN